ncbi:MAG: pilus assembly protein [Xenophilus sp.]
MSPRPAAPKGACKATPADLQRGVVLFVVLVTVLLGTLLALWASRSALLNERVAGNDADYQRVLETAHALLRDAELDIQGIRADGSPCSTDPQAGCRARGAFDAAAGKASFPEDESELQDMLLALRTQSPPCVAGICAPIVQDTATDSATPTREFWAQSRQLETMKLRAARYGDHTGARPAGTGNPLLAGSEPRAWYWIELLPYDSASAVEGGPARAYAPDDTRPYVYRITAVAQGLKPNSQAVLQSVFVWRRRRS